MSSYTSTNTGSAPRSAITSAVAVYVKAGIKTFDPGPIPSANKLTKSASVPLETEIVCFAFVYFDSASSASSTTGPSIN